MSNGQQFYPSPPPTQYGDQARKTNSMAVAGFVLAVLGALTFFIPGVGGFFALLGLIFGIIGLVKSGGGGARKGLSIAAIILAVVAMVVSIVATVVLVRIAGDKIESLTDGQNSAAPVTGKIGEPVKDGQFTFVVNKVLCGIKQSEGMLPSKPQNEFCAVTVSVTNDGADTQVFDNTLVVGFIGATKYGETPTGNTDGDPKPIKPGGSTQAVVMIEVPAGKKLDTVEVHDFILSDGTSVSVR